MDRPPPPTCALCEWIRDPTGRGGSHSVYEDDVALVLVDGTPARRGQAWVIPKAHVSGLPALDERTGMHLFKLGMRAALSLGGTPGDDVQVLLEGDVAAKDPHVHVRVSRRGRGAAR
jgi:diadenosine tetraphosphate (Ap4A) HIT family hydrolase